MQSNRPGLAASIMMPVAARFGHQLGHSSGRPVRGYQGAVSGQPGAAGAMIEDEVALRRTRYGSAQVNSMIFDAAIKVFWVMRRSLGARLAENGDDPGGACAEG